MIVRIMSEGQFRLDDADHARLNELDDAVVAAVDAGDEAAYGRGLAALLAFVRDNGAKLEEEDLEGSDFILPPADTTFAEAGEQFTGDGLIPDPPAAAV